MVDLQPELVAEILSRLQVKDLMLFRIEKQLDHIDKAMETLIKRVLDDDSSKEKVMAMLHTLSGLDVGSELFHSAIRLIARK